LVLHERIDAYILAGSAVVIASVVLVTSAEVTTKKPLEDFSMAETS
jgi:drug/metabolite transporter (DMT)-like permease